ncbi:YggS family pyridoxal phosphate-dependent enzyme [Aequorivita marina]|uniref:YggS family pyridoxal phosphate-dependent enzyme n=1 Tax=Aequorivita marina TaxID=3073654 RepID=UPI002874357A|nr:YggS family pyridoxal phosphate-dependent enzyme [Aequorivita sp. S2608]MDS1299172.1 YggS family pyridoxal phosphate-dependent enzyme [Aequorivita sp. S2608]
MSETITQNLKTIHKRIQAACKKAGRNPDEVRLLLATKTVDSDRINFALQQGETLVGENKAQELQQKCEAIAACSPEVHFIGHLQTNKIKDVIQYASCIESIDRVKLARKLHNRLLSEHKTINAYIQVNTSYEDSKFGVSPENALALIKDVSQFETIKIKGLMTIGLFSSEPEKVRKCFRLLKTIQTEAMALKLPGVSLKELSMGMSGDLEIAIEEGATIVRVGTAIFGERIYPDSYYWDETK